jgi:hypothetical protein
MAIVRVVQMVLHEIIDVIAMGDARVTAIRAVRMLSRVAAACVLRSAGSRVPRRYGNRVFFDRGAGVVVQMAVVHVVHVVLVLDGQMATAGAVLV